MWVERVRPVLARNWNFQVLKKMLWVYRYVEGKRRALIKFCNVSVILATENDVDRMLNYFNNLPFSSLYEMTITLNSLLSDGTTCASRTIDSFTWSARTWTDTSTTNRKSTLSVTLLDRGPSWGKEENLNVALVAILPRWQWAFIVHSCKKL